MRLRSEKRRKWSVPNEPTPMNRHMVTSCGRDKLSSVKSSLNFLQMARISGVLARSPPDRYLSGGGASGGGASGGSETRRTKKRRRSRWSSI